MRQTRKEKFRILDDNLQTTQNAIEYAKTVERNTENWRPVGFWEGLAFAAYRLSGVLSVGGSIYLTGTNVHRYVNGQNLLDKSH